MQEDQVVYNFLPWNMTSVQFTVGRLDAGMVRQ